MLALVNILVVALARVLVLERLLAVNVLANILHAVLGIQVSVLVNFEVAELVKFLATNFTNMRSVACVNPNMLGDVV